MTEWVPVSQVIGNIPVPSAAPPIQTPGMVYGGTPANPGAGTVYGGTGMNYGGQPTAQAISYAPVPPDFHWALVLLIGFFTCGLFIWAWLIVEAAFVKKIKPGSNALIFAILTVCSGFLGVFINGISGAMNHGQSNPLGGLLSFAGLIFYIVSAFQIKSDLEEYYNSVEPIRLQLSGVMTFFFNVYYFQHHFSRIAQWKKTGVLAPQG
jgi:hypothetical protein